jgi:hypothetical protein
VIWTAVSINEQIRNSIFPKELVEEHGPFRVSAPKIHRAIGPVETIAPADIDAVHGQPLTGHFFAEEPEEGARRSLQEDECAILSCHHCAAPRLANRFFKRPWRRRI